MAPSAPHILAASLITLLGSGCDPQAGSHDDDGPIGKADGADVAPSLLCEADTWLEPVPVAGDGLMAYAGRAYVFAHDGLTWSIVRGELATTEPIPLPEGISEMRSVTAEIAPNGRPLVMFRSEGTNYAAFFDGDGFADVTAIGNATEAHADGQGHIYAIDHGGFGLVEYPPGGSPIYRGGLVEDPLLWGVDADGNVLVFLVRNRSGVNLNRVLVSRTLPHGTLSWTDDVEVTANADWGFSNVHFAAAADGSMHLAYGLRYGTYYYRSLDGATWDELTPTDIVSEATLVDPAGSVFDDHPRDVKGSIVHLSAQDYEHATVTLAYNQGSFSVPGFYHMRNCEPYSGLRNTWPAERLSMNGQAFAPTLVAVDERGLSTIVTAAGARQNVTDDSIITCDDCDPDDPSPEDTEPGIPMCSDATEFGPLETPVNLDTADGYGHPLMADGDQVTVFVAGSSYWMTAAQGSATTSHRSAPYEDAESFEAHRSASGGRTVVFRQQGQSFVSANDGPALLAPCAHSTCEARVAGDGHAWIYDGDLHEQVGSDFETRGGPPVAIGSWDVLEDGTVIVASTGNTYGDDYITFWRLGPDALGWTPAGAIPGEIIDELEPQIENGFQEGGRMFAADGSFHLFSSARCIGTGQRNRVQFYLRSDDLEHWQVEQLPAIEQLADNDGHVSWRYPAMWAGSVDRVRYIVMTSAKPVSNGWGWNYPGSRQLNLVERCRDTDGIVGFHTVATVSHPGWSIPGYHAFSETGVASVLTGNGLTQLD